MTQLDFALWNSTAFRLRRAVAHLRAALGDGLDELAREENFQVRDGLVRAIQAQAEWALQEIEEVIAEKSGREDFAS